MKEARIFMTLAHLAAQLAGFKAGDIVFDPDRGETTLTLTRLDGRRQLRLTVLELALAGEMGESDAG